MAGRFQARHKDVGDFDPPPPALCWSNSGVITLTGCVRSQQEARRMSEALTALTPFLPDVAPRKMIADDIGA